MFNRFPPADAGEDAIKQPQPSDHPLFNAARKDDLVGISNALKFGADVDIVDDNGNTPLIMAAAQGCVNAVRLLINNGANIEARGEGGYTPLLVAAFMKQADVLELLLKNKANINPVSDGDKYNALHISTIRGDLASVQALLKAGLGVDLKDARGNTPLIYSAAYNHADIMQILLSEGADKTIVGFNNYTVDAVIEEQGHWHLIEILTGGDAQSKKASRLELKNSHHELVHSGDNDGKEEEEEKENNNNDVSEVVSGKELPHELVRDIKDVPARYICPLSKKLMRDPVTLVTGLSYDRAALVTAFNEQGNPSRIECPVTFDWIGKSALDQETDKALLKGIEAYVASRQLRQSEKAKSNKAGTHSKPRFVNENAKPESSPKEQNKSRDKSGANHLRFDYRRVGFDAAMSDQVAPDQIENSNEVVSPSERPKFYL